MTDEMGRKGRHGTEGTGEDGIWDRHRAGRDRQDEAQPTGLDRTRWNRQHMTGQTERDGTMQDGTDKT